MYHNKRFQLKFLYSEKATKFYEISTVDLSYVVTVKSKVEISQNWPSQKMWTFDKFPIILYFFDKFPFKITDNIPFVTNPAGGEIIATTFRRTQLPNGGFTISRAPLDSGEKVTWLDRFKLNHRFCWLLLERKYLVEQFSYQH